MASPVLATTRYTEIGTYIGQFFMPGAGNLPNDIRVPCLVGKGDRNIIIPNTSMRRSFVFGELLAFSAISPFLATTVKTSDGTQALPTRLYTTGGVEVTANKWEWAKDVNNEFTIIHIIDSAFDPLAQYYLDYQSTSRDVVDVIPEITIQSLSATAQIREVISMGSVQNLQEYLEYRDFIVNFEIDPLVANMNNTNASKSFTPVAVDAAVVGTGTVAVSLSAAYTHDYDRLYTFVVDSATGTSPTRSATMKWSSTPVSMGNGALPSTPLNPAQQWPTVQLDEGSLTNPLTNRLLELGVVVDFDFGASNFTAGDTFSVQARGPSVVELDPRLANTNQFSTVSPIAPSYDAGSTGSMVVSSLPTEYAMTEHNLNIRIECISATGTVGAGNRSAIFVWSGYGTTLISGSFTVTQMTPASMEQTLGATGIKLLLSFGAVHFVVGARYDMQVHAPRIYYQGKEAVRNITFTVGSVNTGATGKAVVNGGYLSDTAEGRYGMWTADTSSNQGRFDIPDALRFYARNAFLSPALASSSVASVSDLPLAPAVVGIVTHVVSNGNYYQWNGATWSPITTPSRLSSGDKFMTQCRSMGTIDFSLLTELMQTVSNPSQIAMDVTGSVTGTVGARYMILDHTPLEIIIVKRAIAGTPILHTWLPGTPFIIITEPVFLVGDGDIQVLYRHQGNEPAPGQTYYMTAKYLRPESFYNQPILFLSADDAKTFLAPSTTKNDLYIGAQICWDYAIQGLFTIQVMDTDDDGVLSKDDYKTAINAFLQDKRATDLVVLNSMASLPDQLQVINRSSDPFENHECLTYIGAPIGTPIGSEQQVGTLVFLSRKTLAVFGQNPAHGTRIMMASTRATRTITLDDGSSTTVTLDGSFIAAAVAGLVASFGLPTETILLKDITSFDTMQTYRQEENLLLGGAQLIYFKDMGSGVYRIYEDVTTDTFSPDTKNLNQMTQKQFVTRDIRRTINGAIIGFVFPSAGAGTATINSTLVSRLSSLASSGFIGHYQTAAGADRAIDPENDTVVFRDTIDPTLFHIGYNYFLATVAKRVFGLYTVNLPGGFPK